AFRPWGNSAGAGRTGLTRPQKYKKMNYNQTYIKKFYCYFLGGKMSPGSEDEENEFHVSYVLNIFNLFL
ncbi:MAG: hypothetical protein ACOC11_03495, partial [Prolixibacteraceae bacterium]